ncbi:MAG: outer membrane beta-barrel protein [Candidatus Nitrotoga sp.]
MNKIVFLLLLALSTSAFAEGQINWTGFYGSVMVGHDWGHVGEGSGTDNQLLPPAYNFTLPGSSSSSFNGVSGTLKLGYNKQIETNLIGIELGGTWQKAKSQGIATDGYYSLGSFVPEKGLHSNTSINTYETVAARLGHIFNDTTLLYVSAGAAVGQIKRSVTDTSGQWFGIGNTISDNKSELGYVLGIGAEHKLNDRLSLRANYEYVDFGKINFSYTGLYQAYPATITQSNSIHLSNISAGISYAF